MSLIRYNGVTLPQAQITSFKKEAVGDDLSDTDWCYMQIDMTVQHTINIAHMPMILSLDDFLFLKPFSNQGSQIPSIAQSTAFYKTLTVASAIKLMRNQLMARRKALSVQFNGQELIPQPAVGFNSSLPGKGVVDSKNGPIPKSFTPIQLTDTTFLMVWHVVAHYWENEGVTNLAGVTQILNRNGSPVLYNRWSEMADIDSLNYVTRTRHGKYVIRSDNEKGNIVDQLRSDFAVVGVPPGFLRKQSQYTVDPSGLGLAYTVTDKEVYKKPPQPAFEAEGEFIETCSLDGGYIRHVEVRVALKGDRDTSQITLLDTAMAVATSKLGINGAPIQDVSFDPVNPAILVDMAAKVWMYDNAVEVHMRAKKAGNSTITKGVAIAMFVSTPLSELGDVPLTSPKYLDGGTAGTLLQAAAYYDPALVNVKINRNTGQMSAGKEVGTVGLDGE